jgi:hypothetical protein
MKEIKLLKMITGEDILAEINNIDPEKVKVKNPVRVIVIPGGKADAPPQVGFAPWLSFTVDTEFSLDRSHIVVIMNPVLQFVKQYTQMFSNVVLPNQQLILPKVNA